MRKQQPKFNIVWKYLGSASKTSNCLKFLIQFSIFFVAGGVNFYNFASLQIVNKFQAKYFNCSKRYELCFVIFDLLLSFALKYIAVFVC